MEEENRTYELMDGPTPAPEATVGVMHKAEANAPTLAEIDRKLDLLLKANGITEGAE